MPAQRIVSLLPSATEMVFALGLGDKLVGVTHECDYPPEARSKPTVVRNTLPIETMSQREIDAAVSERLRQGLSLYEVDTALVEELAPDLIITQSLCDVCAPSDNELARLLSSLSVQPEVLCMTPRTLDEIAENITDLGRAAGCEAAAEQLAAEQRRRIDEVAKRAADIPQRPRVFCMEWLDPVFCSGHWVPEMVRLAGGVEALGREGSDSVRFGWESVIEWAPEILIFMPCGYDLERSAAEARVLAGLPCYSDLPAVRGGRVYAVDASAYFARPGPRVAEGIELIAHLLHPDVFDCPGQPRRFARIDAAGSSRGLSI